MAMVPNSWNLLNWKPISKELLRLLATFFLRNESSCGLALLWVPEELGLLWRVSQEMGNWGYRLWWPFVFWVMRLSSWLNDRLDLHSLSGAFFQQLGLFNFLKSQQPQARVDWSPGVLCPSVWGLDLASHVGLWPCFSTSSLFNAFWDCQLLDVVFSKFFSSVFRGIWVCLYALPAGTDFKVLGLKKKVPSGPTFCP